MHKQSKTMVALLGFVVPALGATSAMAQQVQFQSTITGSTPNVMVAGVGSGASPWRVSLKRGFVSLAADQTLRVKIRNLVRTDTGTASPVTDVVASLVCDGAVVATTQSVPLSVTGDAMIREHVTVPAVCFAPTVLVQIAGINDAFLPQPGPWIAIMGGTGSGQ